MRVILKWFIKVFFVCSIWLHAFAFAQPQEKMESKGEPAVIQKIDQLPTQDDMSQEAMPDSEGVQNSEAEQQQSEQAPAAEAPELQTEKQDGNKASDGDPNQVVDQPENQGMPLWFMIVISFVVFFIVKSFQPKQKKPSEPS